MENIHKNTQITHNSPTRKQVMLLIKITNKNTKSTIPKITNNYKDNRTVFHAVYEMISTKQHYIVGN